uniref:Delta(1)-pyrroline-2-carboxylate reductase n=1 Tax=Tanacetum cinerariifolium TaxID=118510 RepID=A0A699H6F4_TANCI|nr:delta(1)-pyrroline-2-carboxylate reductase [Tanacetum cinerariifolium]
MAGKSTPMFIDGATIQTLLPYKSLINHLQTSLPFATSSIQSPLRHSHPTSSSSTLLLMPSWPTSSSSTFPYIGVKLVTTHPNNNLINLPGVHATYVLFSSVTGQNLASMDATELTLRRTACVSALASSYLSNEGSKVLLVPSMRECDDEAIRRGRVFVDNEVAKVEAGELVGAFERAVIKEEDGVEGDLVELIKGVKNGRKDGKEITVFVSVGSAVVDLLSAQLAYETITVKP